MRSYKVKVLGTGAYLPGDPVRMEDVNRLLGEINEAPERISKWLVNMQPVMKQLLGIDKYYYAIDPVTREFTDSNISMSVKASRKAMERATITADEVDAIFYACSCLEQMPTTSVRIQEELGIKHCAEMSIHSNCTSTYKAIMLAHDLIANGRYKTVMVIASNMPSSQLRSEYFNQKLLQRDQVLLRWFMSDGAGCMIFTRDDDTRHGSSYLEASYVESIGCGYPPIMYDRKTSHSLSPLEIYEKGLHHIIQSGTTIQDTEERYHLLSTVFMEGLDRMARQFDIDLAKTNYFQINLPSKHVYDLIKEKCTSIGIPEHSYYTRMTDCGYAGSPMVLITMDKLFTEEELKPGDQIISFVTEVSKIMQGGFMVRHY